MTKRIVCTLEHDEAKASKYKEVDKRRVVLLWTESTMLQRQSLKTNNLLKCASSSSLGYEYNPPFHCRKITFDTISFPVCILAILVQIAFAT